MTASESRGQRLATPAVLIVGGLTLLAAILRVAIVGQSPFADELSTYWIVGEHSFGDVLRTVKSDAEITPPLFFALSDLATQIELSTAMLRLPSLIAGIATIPLAYLVGVRTVGTRAATVAAALLTLSPFMIFYSTEARGYALLMALMLGSTLALLLALEGRRPRLWLAVYAVCSAGCVYTHYTGAFPLAAQALWALWAHPESRRAVLLANVGAAALFLPWIGGFRADLDSPTTDILNQITPITADSVRVTLANWLFGFPLQIYGRGLQSWREVPGLPAMILMAAGLGLATVAHLAAGSLRARLRALAADRRVLLVLAVALALPVGSLLVSIVSTNLFAARNLAASLPATALLAGALVARIRTALWIPATALLLSGFAIGAVTMLDPDNGRPEFGGIAAEIERLPPGTPVVDAGEITPGPLTSLDVELRGDYPVLRLGIPQQSDHPFNVFDVIAPTPQVAAQAARLARGGRLYVISYSVDIGPRDPRVKRLLELLPPSFEVVDTGSHPGIIGHPTFLLEDRRR